MNKQTLLIALYTVAVAAFIASVKMAQTYNTRNHISPETLIADCGDPPPTPDPGE